MSPNPPDLQFPTDGWAEGTSPDGSLVFVRPPDDILIAHAFDVPPDLVEPLYDIDAIVRHYGTPLAEAGGEIVSVGGLAIDGVPALELVFKTPRPSSGTLYVGALTIPFRDESFVIKVMCREADGAEHPFERLRRHLDQLCATTTLSERVKQCPRFGTLN